MTTTVRSVRVELEAGIDGYVAKMRTAGRETDKAFDRVEDKISAASLATSRLERNTRQLAQTAAESKVQEKGLGDEVDRTGEKVRRTTERTKKYSLEMAVAAERDARLRKGLQEQAKALFGAEEGTDRLAAGIDETGKSASRAERSIDKYSGRLRLLTELAVLGGPALLRLGAGALPLVSAGVAGIAAGGAGLATAVLALQGLGDAFKAIEKYRDDRTAESLQAMRVEMEKLGPAGAHLVRYLDDLRPTLSDLQNVARTGWFPGVEDGIDGLLNRLPQMRKLIGDVATTMGNLSRDAGQSLGGPDFDAFFDYLGTDAAPTLDAFARSVGNVSLGLANMLVAFAPVNRDFTSGLLESTEAFADWSKTLDSNTGFQSFLSTVREAGPELKDFLGASVDALVGLAHASAPLASVTLPLLTNLVKAFGAIASSDAGPALYTAAAGLLAYNRAMKIADATGARYTKTVEKMSAAHKVAAGAGGALLLAGSLTDLDDKLGLSNTAMLASAGLIVGGPWGGALGAGVGLVKDLASANDDLGESIQAASDAMRNGDFASMRTQYENLARAIQDTADASDIDWISRVYGPKEFVDALGAVYSNLSGETGDAEDQLAGLGVSLKEGGGLADLFAASIGLTADQLRVASGSAAAFSGALAELNGWFDKRDAIRGYKDSIDELRDSLKDGFTRDDAANLDNIGRSILQVAENIKNPGARATFLAEARAQLVDMADHAGPKAAAAIQDVINKFDDKGLTHPEIKITADDRRARQVIDPLKTDLTIMGKSTVEPEIGANDNPWRMTYGRVKRDASGLDALVTTPNVDADASAFNTTTSRVGSFLGQLDRRIATPKVRVDPGNSIGIVGQIANMLGGLHDRTVNVTVRTNRIGGSTSSAGGRSVDAAAGSADGSTVPKDGLPYADRHLYLLAPGEEIISNRHGQADRFRADRDAGRIPGYADGGTTGKKPDPKDPKNKHHQLVTAFLPEDVANALDGVGSAATKLEKILGRLEKKVDRASDAYDKQKGKLDDLISRRDSIAGSVSGSLLKDPFGNGLAGFDAQVEADTGDISALGEALATLVHNGLSPKSALYQALAASADVNTAEQLAQLSAGDLASRAQRFDQRAGAASALGLAVANSAASGVGNGDFVQAIADQTKLTAKVEQRLHNLDNTLRQLQHIRQDIRDGAREGSAQGSEFGAAKGAESGTRAGQGDRDHRTRSFVRAGGGR